MEHTIKGSSVFEPHTLKIVMNTPDEVAFFYHIFNLDKDEIEDSVSGAEFDIHRQNSIYDDYCAIFNSMSKIVSKLNIIV